MVRRLLERPCLLVPLGAVGSKAFQALRATLGVKTREGDRLAAGVDAVHQRLLWSQLGLAAQREQRLDPGACSRRSSLANLRVVGHPVGAVIATLVEPHAIVVEALTVALVVVHHIEVVGFPSDYALDNCTLDVPNILTRTYDVAGLTLLIQMIPSDSNNQAIISVFGN